jgi:hypothetical protein
MPRLRVRVRNSQYDQRHRYGYHIVEYNEYEGEGVVDVPAWPARFAIVLGSIMTSWFYLLRIFGVETRLKIPARQEI